MRRAGVLGLVVLLAGCARREASPSPREKEKLAAEIAGCAAVIAPAACALPEDRKVRVFVPAGPEPIALASAVEAGPRRVVAGGELLSVRVADGATWFEVARGTRAVCTFSIAPSPRPSWFAEAQSLRQAGKLDEAEARARAALGGSPAERAMAEGVLARVLLRRGKIDEAVARFREAIADDERAGLVSDRADDAFALAFVLHQRARRYAEARRAIDGAGALEAYAEGRARDPLYRAQIAWGSGDTRTASRLLGEALAAADRIGADAIARAARQVQAMVACSAGNARSCADALREADRELARTTDAPACERAEVVISLGFAELEEAEVTGAIDASRLGAADERGLALLGGACPDPYMRAVANEHLAMAAVLAGDPARARARMKDARKDAPEPRVTDAVMWAEIDARVAELEGNADGALAGFEAARALARGAALRTQEWRAVLGRARVLEARGRADDALAGYTEAERLLDDVVREVAFGEGRASAAADGAEGMRRAVALLVARDRAGDALAMVRRARARLARSLMTSARVAALSGRAREDWEAAVAEYRAARAAVDADAEGDWKRSRASLDAAVRAREGRLAALRARLDDAMHILAGGRGADDLAPLPVEETVLAFARVGARREIVGFVHDAGRTRAFRVGDVPRGASAEELSRALLAPASAELARAKRVRVLADDALAWIDVHALPLEGEPLVARASVVYAADLPAAQEVRVGPRLVVADPTGDLPSARAEGKLVAAALGPEARTLVGKEATAARVREALAGASRFHYAGHGVFRGREGAESALPLAMGGALTLGDVLTLGAVPSTVVLSGCEAGRQQSAEGDGAASMAQAFLVAGATTVVAPVRVVDDGLAGALASQLHAAPDLAEALRDVQARAAHEHRTGWEVFRAFVR